MKAYLTRRYRMSASHRLHSDAYGAEQNRAIYGKCNNPYGHGHNYVVEVTVAGQIDPVMGTVCNLADLDAFAQREIVSRFDQTNLNLHPCFKTLVPTTENLCVEIYNSVESGFPDAELVKIRVEETTNNSFEYSRRAATVPPGSNEAANDQRVQPNQKERHSDGSTRSS